ncbi:MAG: adenylate kinase family enzyme [Ilumatobacter sp.]
MPDAGRPFSKINRRWSGSLIECDATVAIVQRVAIVGSSGAGTSALAQEIAERFGLNVIELDALMPSPDLPPTTTPEFRAKLISAIEATQDRGWVIPGNYRVVADITQKQADTIIWLDFSRSLVTWRLVKRSVRRAITRKEVRGANRERLRDLFSRSPERNVVLWSWRNHDHYQGVYHSYASGKFWSHADVHRLQSRNDVNVFLASISQ